MFIFYDTEEEKMWYTLYSNQYCTLFLWVCIGEICFVMSVRNCGINMIWCDPCYQYSIIDMEPIHVCYKKGYFHYECGNLNMFIYWVRKLNSYGFTYTLHATIIICILQWTIMADSSSICYVHTLSISMI